MAKIILAGPPQSGKSCLRQGLKDATRAIPGAPYPYVITACPDGEGSWFQEACAADPAAARRMKDAYKGAFTEEFVTRIAGDVERCQLPLTLVDIGGRTSAENERICRAATHAVLLAGNKGDQAWHERLVEWRAFFDKLGIPVVAEVYSDYHGAADAVGAVVDGVLHGSVHHLERGENFADRPMVKALAEHLVAIATEG